ncbi:alkaline phosphatase family protein [Nocardia sp. NPDC127579]|uniref:alkaline phosphatase family protein n=1 Tax=Nocardia sp. NPDC127579 TaxID=3345402 RepID=UPI003644B32B
MARVLAVILALLAAVPAPAGARAEGDQRHVVVFGVDGLNWESLPQADTPTLDALISTGYSSPTWLYAPPFAPTVSGPGWATVLTGVWPDRHRVFGNDFAGNALARHPDLLSRVEAGLPGAKTYAGLDWQHLDEFVLGDAIDRKLVFRDDYRVNDQKVADDAATWISRHAPAASFVYLGNVDAAGHECGSAGSCYLPAVAGADRQIGQIIAAIRSRADFRPEDWLLLVTTDHGHTPGGGHGGNSRAERQSFLIAAGGGLTHRVPALEPRLVDVAATALDFLGVGRAGLDGIPITEPSNDPFDSLVGELRTPVDEPDIPAGLRGWTHSTPAGWQIDNSGMRGGGVTEWRGWSFTTDPFWTATQAGQARESNVRARGVFAVADSDEWADRIFRGRFNSRLVSAPVRVTGATAATVSFVSHYRKHGSETATVTVSFDDGAARPVLTYTADVTARLEHLEVPVPAGASTLRVAWELTAGNNDWYWAVDAPGIHTTGDLSSADRPAAVPHA